jgi:hypothetical protein
MTECQGCGAWNDSSRTLCVLCGTPLAATDEWESGAELPPLPPLPDGGLASSMPSWLREPPRLAVTELPAPAAIAAGDDAPPLGPHADPRTFLSDDDFPQWLRDLATRESARSAQTGTETTAPELVWLSWPGREGDGRRFAEGGASLRGEKGEQGVSLRSGGEGELTTPDSRLPSPSEGQEPAAVAARAREERRERSAWETLLLVVLFIGIVIAALWALVANGVFSPAL